MAEKTLLSTSCWLVKPEKTDCPSHWQRRWISFLIGWKARFPLWLAKNTGHLSDWLKRPLWLAEKRNLQTPLWLAEKTISLVYDFQKRSSLASQKDISPLWLAEKTKLLSDWLKRHLLSYWESKCPLRLIFWENLADWCRSQISFLIAWEDKSPLWPAE